jgi:hypothetical protein
MERRRFLIVMILMLVAALACFLAAMVTSSHAHDAPKGWSYPYACCSGYDCREVPADWIDEGTTGYGIVITGEIVGYGDKRLRDSPDGEYHWCSVAGKNDGKTICLFVPPRSY